MADKVKKFYFCKICKKNHSIKFPIDFADNRRHYPFIYFYIHKYTGSSEEYFDKVGADVITTLYIDQNLTIREADVAWEMSSANIMSEYDAQKLVSFLTTHINELQEAYDKLTEKYVKLLKFQQSQQTKKKKSQQTKKKKTQQIKKKKTQQIKKKKSP